MKYTGNYNLCIYELEDVANLADGYNNSMERIDTLLYQMNSMIATANTAISTLQTQVESLNERVAALEGNQ